jgi:chloramphenicol-sensitive protein RarD
VAGSGAGALWLAGGVASDTAGVPVSTAPAEPATGDAASRPASRATRKGLAAGAGAYLLWGVFPAFFPLLKPSGSIEILAHRVLWSLLVVAGMLAAAGRLGSLRTLGRRRTALLALAGGLVAVNWGTFIWGVNHQHVLETSLGYFINPIVTVLFGVLLLGEQLRRAQWIAVGVGAVAVLVLTVDYGRPPWIALVLAFSFGSYGLIKKTVGAGAVQSLTVETAALAVPALVYLGWLTAVGRATFGHVSVGHTLLLVCTGPVTAVPLLLFGAAATRLPLSMLGLLQYLAPVLQFLFGVLIFDEPVPPARLAGFALVWLALAALTAESLRHQRRQVLARAAAALT